MPHGRHEQESIGKICDRFVAPSVEGRCKNVGIISIPSITINIKADFLFIKISGGGSNLEWRTGSVVWQMLVGLG